jgi:hypothetical protein
LEATSGQSETERAALKQLIADISALIDPLSGKAVKLAAIESLHAQPDIRALPFFDAASRVSQGVIIIEILKGLGDYPENERMGDFVSRQQRKGRSDDVKIAAIAAGEQVQVPNEFEMLWEITRERKTSNVVRDAASKALSARHAETLAERGGLEALSPSTERGTIIIAAASSAVVGSVLLNGIGQLAPTEAAPAVGSIGGAIIGAAAGGFYAATERASREDAWQFATGVGWGLALGSATNEFFDLDGIEAEGVPVRVLGVSAGAASAYLALDKPYTIEDTLEINAMGWLGSATGRAYYDLFNPEPEEGEWSAEDNDDPYAIGEEDVWEKRQRHEAGAGIVGALAGLAVGALTSESADFDRDDAAFIATSGIVSTWAAESVPSALGRESGDIHLAALTTALGASAALSQFHNVPLRQSVGTLYGWGSGQILTQGITGFLVNEDMSNLERNQAYAQNNVVGGLVGGVAGAVVSRNGSFDDDGGDTAFIATSTGLSAFNALAIGSLLEENTDFENAGDLVAIGVGGSLIASGLASQYVDYTQAQPLFTASAAGWGAFYAALLPGAINWDPTESQMISTLLVSTDLAAASSIYLMQKSNPIDPVKTLIPQVGGVAGATLATFGTLMFTEEGQPIAIAAMLGSIGGFVGGAAIENKYGDRVRGNSGERKGLLQRLKLPKFEFAISPTVIEGDQGVWVHIGKQRF